LYVIIFVKIFFTIFFFKTDEILYIHILGIIKLGTKMGDDAEVVRAGGRRMGLKWAGDGVDISCMGPRFRGVARPGTIQFVVFQ